MIPAIRNIKVPRTARYFLLGDSSLSPHTVIFALHGYGMQAAAFINHFEPFVKAGIWIVAPEGLSRFYKKGFYGEVVASWMTKEDRLNEIEDYISYLDLLYSEIANGNETRIILFGFSQGAATASRWWSMGNSAIDEIVFWCGEAAPEFYNTGKKLPPVRYVYANQDEFISLEKFRSQTENMLKAGFSVTDYEFAGGHEIDPPTLGRVLSDLNI